MHPKILDPLFGVGKIRFDQAPQGGGGVSEIGHHA